MPLRQLYPDPSTESTASNAARVDIIAVHGLNSRSKNDRDHAWDTWRSPSGASGRLWLRDDLPRHLPDTRILLYEYNSTAVYGKDRDTFIGKANDLLEAIRIERDGTESRPILLLGHSMGGLLIKQALINAHNNPKYTPIKDATTGLAFFATPHHGADWLLVSLAGVVAKIATSVGFQKGDDVLETLKNGSIFSEIMQEHWRHQLLKYDIISFWGALDNIVPAESARFGMPGDHENVVKLNADHRGVCKFGPSLDDQDNFKLVRSNIKDLYLNALKTSLAVEPFLEERDDKGRTALHKASESGILSQVIELLEQGAKINTEDNDWKRPLHLAAESGEEALVRYLLRKGADVHGADSENRHALHLAAQRGHDKVVLCLLLGGSNINARDARGRTALHHAAVTGQDQVIDVLVKEGANRDIVDENKNTAWNLAWNGGLMSTQKLLLSINQRWKLGAEMYNAIMAKDLTSLQKKLDEGLDPDFKTKAGSTLLLHVAFAGKNNNDMVFSEMAKLLLDRGADVQAKSRGGFTPLHYAALAKDYATMKVLVERGADVNAKGDHGHGSTPLDFTLNDPHAHRLLRSYANQGSQRGLPIRQTR